MGESLTLDQMRTAQAGFQWLRNPALNRIARHPAIRAALIIAQTEADAQQIRTDPGLQAALGLLGHPAARNIMAQTDLLYGQAVYDSALDVGVREALRQRSYLASDLAASSAYGIGIGNTEAFPALSDVLSHAAGRPINAGALTPEEALGILDDYQTRHQAETRASIATRTDGNVSVRSTAGDIDCFEVPEGVDPEEFKRQLKEQEDALNNTDIETLQRRRADFINGNARRDTGAQRQARRDWISERARVLRRGGATDAVATATATREAMIMDATHVLDMIAGGDPSAISGLGNSSINRSIGPQWRGRRVNQLDAKLEEQRKQGRTKPDIKLEVCP